MGRKNKTKAMTIGMVLLAAIALVAVAGLVFSPAASSTDTTPDGVQKPVSCDGISQVAFTYNDVDRFAPGTDPGTANLYVTTDNMGSQSEGSINFSPLGSYEGLAGYGSTSVFAEPVTWETGCSNEQWPIEVVSAGAPTITVVNDDGVTSNTDAAHESMDADSTYVSTITVKAPAKECAARHGAIMVLDYDKTYVKSVEVLELSAVSDPDYLTNLNLTDQDSDSDAFDSFLFEGELCNGAKEEFSLSVETTSSTPGEGDANVGIHWLPRNYDINLDTIEILGPDVEDEDNNALVLGNTTDEYHTA